MMQNVHRRDLRQGSVPMSGIAGIHVMKVFALSEEAEEQVDHCDYGDFPSLCAVYTSSCTALAARILYLQKGPLACVLYAIDVPRELSLVVSPRYFLILHTHTSIDSSSVLQATCRTSIYSKVCKNLLRGCRSWAHHAAYSKHNDWQLAQKIRCIESGEIRKRKRPLEHYKRASVSRRNLSSSYPERRWSCARVCVKLVNCYDCHPLVELMRLLQIGHRLCKVPFTFNTFSSLYPFDHMKRFWIKPSQ